MFFGVFSNFAITFYISNYSKYPVEYYAFTPKKHISDGWETLALEGEASRLYDAGVATPIIIYWRMNGKEYFKAIKIAGTDKVRLGKEFVILDNGGYYHNLKFRGERGTEEGKLINEEQ